LRDGKVIELGDLRLEDAQAGRPWYFATLGQTASLWVERPAAPGSDAPFDLAHKTMSLQGERTPEVVLHVQKAAAIDQTPGRLIVVAALSVATGIKNAAAKRSASRSTSLMG